MGFIMSYKLLLGFCFGIYWVVTGALVIRDMRKSALIGHNPFYCFIGFLLAPILAPWAGLTWVFEKLDVAMSGRKGENLDHPLGEQPHAMMAGGVLLYIGITAFSSFMGGFMPETKRAPASALCSCDQPSIQEMDK